MDLVGFKMTQISQKANLKPLCIQFAYLQAYLKNILLLTENE